MQQDIESLNSSYKKLLQGDLSIDEFWTKLFPFINGLLNDNDYKEDREKMGQVTVDSLRNLLINLRDKRQSFREKKDLGDDNLARMNETLFISVSEKILDKLKLYNKTTPITPIGKKPKNSEDPDNKINPINPDEKINTKPPIAKIKNNLIFISYARQDFDYAFKLYNALRVADLNPWLDKEDISPGDNYDKKIKEAIKECKFFLPLFSSTSVAKRGYIQREFKMGVDILEEIPEDQVFVIPIRIDECQIPFEKLSKIHYQDMFPNWETGVQKIVSAIKKGI